MHHSSIDVSTGTRARNKIYNNSYKHSVNLLPYLCYLVYVPSNPVKARNASAYVLTVGDVQEDVSKTQVCFDTPQTDNPIVISGVKKLNLHEVAYNGIRDYFTLHVKLYSGKILVHEVGFHLTKKCGFAH